MKTVKVGIKSQDKASRLELLVRIVWFIVSSIVFWFFSIVAIVCVIIHWFYILVKGKRHKGLNNLIGSYVTYRAEMLAYGLMVTEERNPIFPED